MLKKFFKYWIPVIFWCCVIFSVSSIPNLRIEQLGYWDFLLRKIAHFTEFGILSILFFRAIIQTTNRAPIFWSNFFSIVYAILDEFHQYFVPGRYTNLIDVIIDSLGAIILLLLYRKLYP